MNPSLAHRRIPNPFGTGLLRIIDGRRVSVLLLVGAGVLAVTGMLSALLGTPVQDFRVDIPNREVTWVLPGGGTWSDGIRAGQELLRLGYGREPSDWELVTIEGGGISHGSTATGQEAQLRETMPAGVLAVALTAASLFLVGRRRKLAAALGMIVIGISAIPLTASNGQWLSAFVLAGLPLATATSVALEVNAPMRRLWLPIAAAVTLWWLAARFVAPATFEAADAARLLVTTVSLMAVLWLAAPWRAWIGATLRLDPSLAVDLGTVIVVISASAVAVGPAAVPVWFIGPVAVGLLAFYPRVRRRLGGALEQVLFGGIRDHAAIAATEEERARLASEIHDGPLQELAAVITELDGEPRLADATGVLRGVAAELRGVSTALRPPVLDDLGLGAAIRWLVDQSRIHSDSARLECSLEDSAHVGRGSRPPADVELAAFRIVQESLGNAVRHAQATLISVSGTIDAQSVELAVEDNGVGVEEQRMRSARRSGRLGLLSMRQRAQSIDADLVIENRPGRGTSVRLRWRSG